MRQRDQTALTRSRQTRNVALIPQCFHPIVRMIGIDRIRPPHTPGRVAAPITMVSNDIHSSRCLVVNDASLVDLAAIHTLQLAQTLGRLPRNVVCLSLSDIHALSVFGLIFCPRRIIRRPTYKSYPLAIRTYRRPGRKRSIWVVGVHIRKVVVSGWVRHSWRPIRIVVRRVPPHGIRNRPTGFRVNHHVPVLIQHRKGVPVFIQERVAEVIVFLLDRSQWFRWPHDLRVVRVSTEVRIAIRPFKMEIA